MVTLANGQTFFSRYKPVPFSEFLHILPLDEDLHKELHLDVQE